MMTIDLNADVGEGAGFDHELIPLVTSVTIACGAHAGDARSMANAMALAAANDVVVGAHPGFADRDHMGRREINLSSDEIFDLVSGQLVTLRTYGEFCYVKPHGALYHLAARDWRVAAVVVSAVKAFDSSLTLMALAGSVLLDYGRAEGVPVVAEGFADRAYDRSGGLVAREVSGALIDDENVAVAQVLSLIRHGQVKALTGERVEVDVDSICLHGDNPRAVDFARRLRETLSQNSISVRAFSA
jgi:UPF0271 protein